MNNIRALAPNLKLLEGEASELVHLTSTTAGLADDVSAKVKHLDMLKVTKQKHKDVVQFTGVRF